MPEQLLVTIPDKNNFYSLYADGLFARKLYLKDQGITLIYFDPSAVVFLFYTYPTCRQAAVIRNVQRNSRWLPGLSKPVSLIFSVHASRVDKLRRAAAFLNARSGGAYSWDDGFYIRLSFILSRPGKLNYAALRSLARRSPKAPAGLTPS
jgi:hypothetical protein